MAIAFENTVKSNFAALTDAQKKKIVKAYVAEFKSAKADMEEISRKMLLAKRGPGHFVSGLMYGAKTRKTRIADFVRKFNLAGVRETKSFVANFA